MKAKIRVVFLLTVLFLLVILSGCVAPESPATTPKQTETPTSTATELSLKIGETAKLQGVEVTVISANRIDNRTNRDFTYSYSGATTNTRIAISAGKIIVLVDVEIKNTGEKGFKFLDILFHMTDSAGFEHDILGNDYEEPFETDNLYPNSTRRGKILFEVPREAKGLKIKLSINSLNMPGYEILPTKVKSVSWSLE